MHNPNPEGQLATDWFAVFAAALCGVAVAMNVGKVPIAMAQLRQEFGLSLVAAGWVSSMFNTLAVFSAIFFGMVCDRVGALRMCYAGLAVSILGGIGGLLSPTPTRAEASDVANAIFDGTDAVMLSGETAAGHYPVETVEMMVRIVDEAERSMLSRPFFRRRSGGREVTFSDATAEAACVAAQDLGARAIVAFTQSGATARLISKQRPRCPVFGFTPHPEIVGRMAFFWGVHPRCLGGVVGTDEMFARVDAALLKEGAVAQGDTVVIVAGAPLNQRGGTNFMKLHRVGELDQ